MTAPPGVWPAAWAVVLSEETPTSDRPEPDMQPDHSRAIRDAHDKGEPAFRPPRDDVADAMACPVDGCGHELRGTGAARGWVLVRVVGSGDPPRRYCSGSCASKGIAHVELGNHHIPRATITELPRHADYHASTLTATGAEAAVVREWAATHGYAIAAKGRVPASVRQAFIDAHTTTGATA